MKRKTISAVFFVLFLLNTIPAAAQTTIFTHQGKLAVVDGTYEFEFTLFDAPTGGNQIGSTYLQVSPPVFVSNNTFSVLLDFGAAVFSGPDRFLETGWRAVGGTTFIVLSPRELISSSPYAIRSLSSATADAATNATQLGGLPMSGFIQNTASQQAATNFNVSGDGTAGGTLSGNTVNAGTQYNVGGIRVLSVPGLSNVFVGRGSGNANTNGDLNSFFGETAGSSNTSGRANTFLGGRAGWVNTTGLQNTFVGAAAGSDNIAGANNSFFGAGAGSSSRSDNNSFFGSYAGSLTNIGGQNSFFGASAGANNTTGVSNTFVGAGSGFANATGISNTLVGNQSNVGANNLVNATALGALAFVTANNSLVLGSINGINGATVDTRVGIGTTAPSSKLQVIDSSNTGLRVQTNVVGGTVASFGGNGAFQIDAPGIVGGRFSVTEAGNTGIGVAIPATRLHISGSGIVRARVNSDSNAGLALTLNNQPKWSVATTTGNNFLIFNDAIGQNAFSIDGATNVIGINALGSPGISHLCINGSNQISGCSSSMRYKTNIAALPSGLNLINRLRPVTFDWKQNGEPDLGLVAEEVAKVEPLLVTHNDKGEIEGVKYDRVGVLLVNAVKEQQQTIDSLQKENLEMKARLATLERLMQQQSSRQHRNIAKPVHLKQ